MLIVRLVHRLMSQQYNFGSSKQIDRGISREYYSFVFFSIIEMAMPRPFMSIPPGQRDTLDFEILILDHRLLPHYRDRSGFPKPRRGLFKKQLEFTKRTSAHRFR